MEIMIGGIAYFECKNRSFLLGEGAYLRQGYGGHGTFDNLTAFLREASLSVSRK